MTRRMTNPESFGKTGLIVVVSTILLSVQFFAAPPFAAVQPTGPAGDMSGSSPSTRIAGSPGSSPTTWPDFKAQGVGPGSDCVHVGGLGFTVLLDQPRLWKIPVIPMSSQYWLADRGLFPGPRVPFDFGAFSCGEKPAVKELERDWAHVGVEISPSLKLNVTRLSPALVFDCDASQLTLFSGGKVTPVAVATTGGVFAMNQSLDKARPDAGQPWVLLWFGKGAGLRSTRHPWPMRNTSGDTSVPFGSLVDCPMLVLFANPPAAMTAKDGVTFTANGQGRIGKVVLLPLYGDLYPKIAETEAWSKAGKLPEAVAASCLWWAERLAEVPLTARQQYRYDKNQDEVTIATTISYLKVREGGVRLAPLPPVMTIAQEHGFPMQLSGKPARSSVITAVGPYAGIEGVDQYECRVTGLAKYVRETAMPAAAGEPAEIHDLLKEEIAKITQAGHLAPWMPITDSLRTYFVDVFPDAWAIFSTTETLTILGEALPLLDKAQQEDVKAYLKRERQEYPPELVAMPPMNVGAHRERTRLDGAGESYDCINKGLRDRSFYLVHHMVPPEALYALWSYAQTVEPLTRDQARNVLRQVLSANFLHRDWATLGDFAWPGLPWGKNSYWTGSLWGDWYGQGGELDANQMFTGLVGALRLATQADDTEILPTLWGQFALTAIRRYALGRYADFLYQDRVILLPTDPSITQEQWATECDIPTDQPAFHQRLVEEFGQPDWQVRHFVDCFTPCIKTYKWIAPQDDVRAVIRMNEYGVMFSDSPIYFHGNVLGRYAGLAAPELARFLVDFEGDKARQFVDRVADNVPSWHLAYSTTRLGAEQNYHHPRLAYDQFLLRACVLKEPPDKLARYLDIPWVERGDLYYIHKLVETIKAYRGTKWNEGANDKIKS